MTAPRPIDVTRKDGVLVPRQKWLFDRLFEEGKTYQIELFEPRSTKSQAHYFAVVNEAWKNLPEQLSAQHPDSEHLRKFALIKTGWCNKRNIVCETVEQAYAVAALAGQLDESAVVVVQGTVVTVATAKSQKMHGPGAMGREDFQKSKQDVLDYVAGLIGVNSSTLSSQVPNSSGVPHEGPDNDRTDAPAGDSGPQTRTPAGAHLIEEASLLSDDWRDVYITTLTGPTTRALSVMSRDTQALQMMGCPPNGNAAPNALEREWMRRVATLTVKRDRGKLKAADFEAEIAKLKELPLKALIGEQDAA